MWCKSKEFLGHTHLFWVGSPFHRIFLPFLPVIVGSHNSPKMSSPKSGKYILLSSKDDYNYS